MKAHKLKQPPGTQPYIATTTDTLSRIAAHHQTTVSELKKINKLMSDYIYPTQIIFIPSDDYVTMSTSCPSSGASSPQSPDEFKVGEVLGLSTTGSQAVTKKRHTSHDLTTFSMSPPSRRLPGHIERDAASNVWVSPPRPLSDDEVKKLDEECHERFVKLRVTYINENDVEVPGVFLVTPDAVMFDPEETHPLVLRDGACEYSMVVPMNCVTSASVYHDVEDMKCKRSRTTAAFPRKHNDSCPLSSVQPNRPNTAADEDLLLQRVLAANVDPLSTSLARRTSEIACLVVPEEASERGSSTTSDSVTDGVTTVTAGVGALIDGVDALTEDVSFVTGDVCVVTDNGKKETLSFVTDTQLPESDPDNLEADLLLRPSDANKSLSGSALVDSSVQSNASSNEARDSSPTKSIQKCEIPDNDAKDRDFSTGTGLTPLGVTLREEGVLPGMGGLVAGGLVEGQINFSGFEFLDGPTVAGAMGEGEKCDNIRTDTESADAAVEKRSNEVAKSRSPARDASSHQEQEAADESDSLPVYLCVESRLCIDPTKEYHIEAYAKSPARPAYWFSIPLEKVDRIYAFFVQWSPTMINDDDDFGLTAAERGFVVVDASVNLDLSKTSGSEKRHRKISKDWEIVNVKEWRRRVSLIEVASLPLPDLSEPSKVFEPVHLRTLMQNLPARAEGSRWHLVYCTERHGFSLKTLYRRMLNVDSPVVVIIKDNNNQIFGALLSCAIKQSEHFYGTGECYLFTFYPEFKKYSWAGMNSFFIKGNTESLCIGASEGANGLWFDGDLYRGRTQTCLTFNNELLTVGQDFMIVCFEAWSFD